MDEIRKQLIALLEGSQAHMTLEDAVEGFPRKLINHKPDNLPYSLWHLMEHIRLSQRDMLEYIENPNYKEPNWPDDFWPKGEADEKMWKKTISDIKKDTEALKRIVAKEDILEPIPHMDNRSILRAILVIADHNAYHIGEFAVLRGVLNAWNSKNH